MMTQRQMEIWKRRDQVVDLYSKGLTQRQIASQLNLEPNQVLIDLKKYREQMSEELQKQTESHIYADHINNLLMRKKQLWAIALDPSTSKYAKIQALNTLGAEDDRAWKRAQTLGFVRAEHMEGATIINADNAQTVNVQNNVLLEWERTLRQEILTWQNKGEHIESGEHGPEQTSRRDNASDTNPTAGDGDSNTQPEEHSDGNDRQVPSQNDPGANKE